MKQKQKSTLIGLLIGLIAKVPQPLLQNILVPLLHKILWYGRSDLRRITEINLKLCFKDMSEQEREQLAKESLRQNLKTILEFPATLKHKKDDVLAKVIRIDGQEFIDKAQKEGKGVLFISPHLGNWEVLGLKLGDKYALTGMFKPGRYEALNQLLSDARERGGAKLVPTDMNGVRAVLKTLKKGGFSGILPDQIPEAGNGSVFVSFFSEPAATMTLIASLVQKSGAVAIGCFAKRLDDGNFEIIYRPAHSDLYNPDKEIAARGLNKTVENLILMAPEQYQWIYKRFRIGPDGKRQIYKSGS